MPVHPQPSPIRWARAPVDYFQETPKWTRDQLEACAGGMRSSTCGSSGSAGSTGGRKSPVDRAEVQSLSPQIWFVGNLAE